MRPWGWIKGLHVKKKVYRRIQRHLRYVGWQKIFVTVNEAKEVRLIFTWEDVRYRIILGRYNVEQRCEIIAQDWRKYHGSVAAINASRFTAAKLGERSMFEMLFPTKNSKPWNSKAEKEKRDAREREFDALEAQAMKKAAENHQRCLDQWTMFGVKLRPVKRPNSFVEFMTQTMQELEEGTT